MVLKAKAARGVLWSFLEFGGGEGMLLKPEPLFEAVEAIGYFNVSA